MRIRNLEVHDVNFEDFTHSARIAKLSQLFWDYIFWFGKILSSNFFFFRVHWLSEFLIGFHYETRYETKLSQDLLGDPIAVAAEVGAAEETWAYERYMIDLGVLFSPACRFEW